MQAVMSRAEVSRLLRDERIETHFHAITSIRRQAVVGLEALSRGLPEPGEAGAGEGELIPPSILFASARACGLELDLDRACRRAAMRAFAPIHRANPQWGFVLGALLP